MKLVCGHDLLRPLPGPPSHRYPRPCALLFRTRTDTHFSGGACRRSCVGKACLLNLGTGRLACGRECPLCLELGAAGIRETGKEGPGSIWCKPGGPQFPLTPEPHFTCFPAPGRRSRAGRSHSQRALCSPCLGLRLKAPFPSSSTCFWNLSCLRTPPEPSLEGGGGGWLLTWLMVIKPVPGAPCAREGAGTHLPPFALNAPNSSRKPSVAEGRAGAGAHPGCCSMARSPGAPHAPPPACVYRE